MRNLLSLYWSDHLKVTILVSLLTGRLDQESRIGEWVWFGVWSLFMRCSFCSINGEGEAIGIVPRFAQELFDRIEGTADDEVCVCVCVCRR